MCILHDVKFKGIGANQESKKGFGFKWGLIIYELFFLIQKKSDCYVKNKNVLDHKETEVNICTECVFLCDIVQINVIFTTCRTVFLLWSHCFHCMYNKKRMTLVIKQSFFYFFVEKNLDSLYSRRKQNLIFVYTEKEVDAYCTKHKRQKNTISMFVNMILCVFRY